MKKKRRNGKEDMAVLAYLAGLLDGEGSIGVSEYKRKDRTNKKSYYCLRIKVTNKNRQAINLFKDTFKCGCIYRDKRSDVWEWALTSGDKIKEILTLLKPFLIIKRKQAKAALTFEVGNRALSDEQVGKQIELKARMHRLNKQKRKFSFENNFVVQE